MICAEEQFDAIELIKTFSINLNAQYVNGRTHFDSAELVKLVKMHGSKIHLTLRLVNCLGGIS